MRALAHPALNQAGGVTLLVCEGCRWPVGRRDGTSFFCDAPAALPASYCAEHMAVAYRPGPLAEIEL